MKTVIDKERNGKTVLEILKKELRLSSKMITMLKKREDGITVDGEHVTVRRILREGEVLSLSAEDREENENLIPAEIPLDIIFEDDDIILINKPPMMPTHPSHGHFDDTLANGVCFHMLQKRGEPFVFRSVNRLDRNTSGLVLIAKNRLSASKLYSAMQKGQIEKKYIALLSGRLPDSSGTIDTFIRRKKASIITREICGDLPDAARAITNFEVLSSDGIITAVKACPITGRTHQLRLHFAHLGAPILGDDLYGSLSEEIERQALHAFYLSFPHPSTEEIMIFTAPLPKDMEDAAVRHNLIIEV
ncbi:MAG: RluA family pseudouridine synthase [Clostridia bacterium]|nr:RluA family pseudouridine synthase [Clostridia bacterium]